MTWLRTLAALTASLAVACGGDEAPAPTVPARPVTVLRLSASAPPPSRLVPGLVTPYRQTPIPFEVAGRLERIADVGEDVLGEQLDSQGQLVEAGSVIASIDPAPYERALRRAEESLNAAGLQLEAHRIQLETVLQARLTSTRNQAAAATLNAQFARDDVEALTAAVDLAETTLERNRSLLPSGAVSDIAVRQSETDLAVQRSRLAQARTLVTTRERESEAAQAAIAEVEGQLVQQKATTEAQAATVRQLEEALEDARSALEDCVLRAPFDGRVTEQHVGEGSFVQAGAPVVTLTMMTPVEVEVAVSAEDDERLVVGTDAFIYPLQGRVADLERGVRATLYEKRGIADTGTRTFRLGLIAPNQRRNRREGTADLPSTPFLLPVLANPLDLPDRDGLYVIDDTLADSTQARTWVLKARDITQGRRDAAALQQVMQGDRVAVSLGDDTIQVGSFTLYELADAGSLEPQDLLVPNPTAAHADGFVVDDARWLLRPGDLVQVALDQATPPAGFYVPVQAIREVNGETWVFVVGADDTARAVPVIPAESVGERRRVIADGLSEGDELVVSGAHFLLDGDAVTRVSTVGEATP